MYSHTRVFIEISFHSIKVFVCDYDSEDKVITENIYYNVSQKSFARLITVLAYTTQIKQQFGMLFADYQSYRKFLHYHPNKDN